MFTEGMRDGALSDLSRRRVVPAFLALTLVAGLLSLGPVAAAIDCGPGIVAELLDGRLICSHPDEAPPGVDLKRRPSADELRFRQYGTGKRPIVAPATSSGTVRIAAAGSIECFGNGTDGNRVQAIYARASDVPDRFSSVASLIAQYAADADYQLNISGGLLGAGRRIRFVTQSCALHIARVTLTPSGDNSFSAMRSEIRAQGYNRSDRKYLIWGDAAVGICGIAEMAYDDRPTSDNWNNRGPNYARVDAPCWGYAEAHELLHNLGAVQDSAPHSTGAGHCVDENDTMCYRDTSGITMLSLCPLLPSWQVDCNADDYYNTSASPSGYLGTHWNTANSSFLEGVAPPPDAPSITLNAPSSFYAGLPVGVSASVSVPVGRTFTVGWTTTRTDCRFSTAAGTSNAFWCPATATGSGQITATVVDSEGMSSSATRAFTLRKPSKKRGTSTGFSASDTRIRRGEAVRLTGSVVDPSGGRRVIGDRVSIYYRRVGTTTWRWLKTLTTDSSGRISYRVWPGSTREYRLVSRANITWASDPSSTRRITVT